MSRFLNPRFNGIKSYTPGEQPRDQAYVKLNTNESPYPPAPAVLRALGPKQMQDLRLYCDPEGLQLRRKLAAYYGLQPEQVMLTNGSDDVINFALTAFSGNGIGAAFPDVTYGFYEVIAALQGVQIRKIPLQDDFTIRIEDYFGLSDMILLSNPNAPTGIALPVAAIEQILQRNPDQVVLVDEAYVDFGGQSSVGLIDRYDNLLVSMTFSKSRSLAGGRLGFVMGQRQLIADLNQLRYSTNPYNVNRMTLACGEAAIDNQTYYDDCCQEIMQTREMTRVELERMGFSSLPSKANFLFAQCHAIDGGELYLELKKKGVLVRHFTAPRIAQYNRITIGTPEQMGVLFEKTREILLERGIHV